MYEKILDECQVARSLVDVLRSITDAPLVLCVDAARAALACISPYIKDESFNKIEQAMKTYCIDVDNCYDSHCLTQIGERLEQLFKEKEELCYSTRQDDIELIEYLTKFADYTVSLFTVYLLLFNSIISIYRIKLTLEFQWPSYLVMILNGLRNLLHCSKCLGRKLRFLLEILKKGSDLVSSLFYSNDLGVLSNIVVRELNNSEDEMASIVSNLNNSMETFNNISINCKKFDV
uniref:DUF2013 domain-containing protein n=1 Tax=Heterorhabditis bacteriophora TaxID=37862 RepID=A0A1I7WMF2_HETBA